MNIKKIIQEEKDGVIKLLLKQIVSLEWSKRFVEETDEDIKNFDLDKHHKEIKELRNQLGNPDKAEEFSNQILEKEEKKKEYDEYMTHFENIEKTEEAMEQNALSYKDLDKCEDEITNLLK